MTEIVLQKTHNQGCIILDQDFYNRMPNQVVVDIDLDKSYTKKQRGALHVWCDQVAKTLNDAGLELVRKSLFGNDEIEIAWTMILVKEHIYKYLLNSITGKTSTESQTTIEPSDVANTIIRHFSNKGVILPPWPSNR